MSEKSKEFLNKLKANASPLADDSFRFEYPNLASIFEPGAENRLRELRAGYKNAMSDLDHIIRSGSPSDAESASKALRAITLTLELLETIETESKT